jgi:hypothetical protein
MPAPQLRAVSPDDPRAKLRDAISRVVAAQTAITQAEAARDRVHGQYLAALRSLDVAKDALRSAEADNQQHRVAHLLGEMTGAPALSDLRRAVELAETVAAGARSDEQLLDDEIRRRRTALDFATTARSQAISDVLRPAAAGLLQRLADHLTAAAGLRGALHTLPLDCLPNYWDAHQEFPEDIALTAKWRDVVESLAAAADAAIPQE